MLDGVVIENEVAHAVKSGKKPPSMMFKVDFENAYDTVDWGFLRYMMQRMNFCAKWIRWIDGCLASASVSVLVNGSPCEEFGMKRGVRQGDPLAPFLFLIVVEGLTGLVRRAMALKKLVGFKVGKSEEVEVTKLQFVDDTLLMGEATFHNVLTTKCILKCFELALGLKVIFLKSRCVGISVPEGDLQLFVTILNCKVVKLPFTYLGIPIGGNPRRTTLWQPILAKMRWKLSSWKQKSFSVGGRLCLFKCSQCSTTLLIFLPDSKRSE